MKGGDEMISYILIAIGSFLIGYALGGSYNYQKGIEKGLSEARKENNDPQSKR